MLYIHQRVFQQVPQKGAENLSDKILMAKGKMAPGQSFLSPFVRDHD